MVKQEKVTRESGETPEQEQFSNQLRSLAEQEGLKDRSISELSTEEIERILQERKTKQSKEKGDKLVAEKESRWGKFLKDLGDDFSVGEPQLPDQAARGAEYVGIYKGEEYIGTIVSEGGISGGFTDREFQDKAYNLVAGKPKSPESKPLIKVECDTDAKDVMAMNGILLSGNQLILERDMDFRALDLYNNGENEEIGIEKIDDRRVLLVITEKAGKVIEYTIENGKFMPESRRVRIKK